ncbi:hypothetical protein AB1285_17005 [Microbacterium sp. NRRL B-14842]|uniref:hypothetical protein n=1 Tax=Microbacterium sp. NRRL B-14842 TaxID=3162881 RepID=UPI003D2CFC33
MAALRTWRPASNTRGSSIAAAKTPVLRARSASPRKARQLASSKKRTAVGPMIWTNEAAM